MGSTGKSTNYGTITKPDGTVVHLPDKLVYSKDTGSGNIPQSVLDFEKQYRKAKIEHLILESSVFGTVGTHKGNAEHVSASMLEHSMADITSHNHPRTGDQQGWLSGTFSPQDISVFSNYHTTDRVTGAEGIYSITKGANFKDTLASDFATFADNMKTSNDAKIPDIQARLNADYKKLKSDFNAKAKGMSYTQFEKEYETFKKDWDNISAKYQNEVDNLANRSAIAMHNWLLDNQKKYGYTYGLTRW